MEGEVLLDAVHRGEIVVFDLAQLEEARRVLVSMSSVTSTQRNGAYNLLFAELRRIVDQKVNDDIASGSFEEDAHDCRRAISIWNLIV